MMDRSLVIALGDMPWASQCALERMISPTAICNLPATPEEVLEYLDGFGDRVSFVADVKKSSHIVLCVPERMHGPRTGVLAGRLRQQKNVSEVQVATYNGNLKLGDKKILIPESSPPEQVVIACADTRASAGIDRLVGSKPMSVVRLVGAGLGEHPTDDSPAKGFAHFAIKSAFGIPGQKHKPIIVTHDKCAGYPSGNSPKRRIRRISETIPNVCDKTICVCHAHVTNNGVFVGRPQLIHLR